MVFIEKNKMACSKYNLTNTGNTIVTFNYQRCDDALWQYQVELLPSEAKNIWLLNNTYSSAFPNRIVLVNLGEFPSLTLTPTPSITPSPTPTFTSTPTNTQTQTPTPTTTLTSTPTQTQTQTPTPTNVVRTAIVRCHDETDILTTCDCVQTATIFVNGTSLSNSTLAWSDGSGPNTGNPLGYYSEGGILYIVSSDCGPGCVSGSTITVDGVCGPTPTPTNTQTPTNTGTPTGTPTPTPTPVRFSFSVTSGSTANEACSSGATNTIWGDAPLFDNCTQFYPESFGPSTMLAGFYANSGVVTEIDSNGAQVGAFSSCSVVPTPTATVTPTATETPTPTPTTTPTATRGYYEYILGSGSTTNDACDDFSTSPQTIYGSVAGGPGPNVGETLYQTAGNPPTVVVPDGYYSNGVAWFLVSGGSGLITSSDPNGCIGLPTQTPTSTMSVTTTPTPTNTQTPTQTQTPTPTTPVSYIFGFDGFSVPVACANHGSSPTTYYSLTGISVGAFLYNDSSLTSPAGNGYYSDGSNYYEITAGNGQISFGPASC